MQNSLGIQPAEYCGGRRGRCRRKISEGLRERPPAAGDGVSGSLELTGGGLRSYNLLHTASSPCPAITLSFPHRAEERRAAHQVLPASRLFRVVGGAGVQRGVWGASGGEKSSGEPRGRPYRPGLGPGRWRVRAPTPQPLPARAPLSGAPGPASAAARSPSPAGLHAERRLRPSGRPGGPGSGKAPSLRAASCAWQSRGRSPAPGARRPRRCTPAPGTAAGGCREGSLR